MSAAYHAGQTAERARFRAEACGSRQVRTRCTGRRATRAFRRNVALAGDAAKRRQKVIQNTPPNWQGSIGVDEGHRLEGLRATGHVRFSELDMLLERILACASTATRVRYVC